MTEERERGREIILPERHLEQQQEESGLDLEFTASYHEIDFEAESLNLLLSDFSFPAA